MGIGKAIKVDRHLFVISQSVLQAMNSRRITSKTLWGVYIRAHGPGRVGLGPLDMGERPLMNPRERESRPAIKGGRGFERASTGWTHSEVTFLLTASVQGLPVPEVEDEMGDSRS